MESIRALNPTERMTAGSVAEKDVRIPCEECQESYDVHLKAYGSARGSSDDPEALSRKAQAIADKNLEGLTPMEACPRCGHLQGDMVERTFMDPRQAGARRRWDGCRRAINSPFARALRLHARGRSIDEIAARLSADEELRALLELLERDPHYEASPRSARARRIARSAASFSEGERLAACLQRRRVPPPQVRSSLSLHYGLSPEAAADVVERLKSDRGLSGGSINMAALGVIMLLFGAVIAFLLGVVAPLVREARRPKPAEPDHLSFPSQIHYSHPRDLQEQGVVHPVPVVPYGQMTGNPAAQPPDRDPEEDDGSGAGE